MPEFCARGPLVFVILLAQLVVLVLALAPRSAPSWSVAHFVSATVFAQLIAVASVLVLCGLRRRLLGVSRASAHLLVWAVPVLVAVVTSALVWLADPGELLGLESPWRGAGFAPFLRGVCLLAALVSLVSLRYFQITGEREAGIRAEARARYDALQARIRPHFLFNALNSVAALVRIDAAKAESAIEDLADVLRAVIRSPEQAWSLGEEVELCQRYLAIEMLRLGEERLRVNWRIGSDVPGALQLPALMLQPLVENAVLHGVARLAAGGSIDVDIRVAGNTLRIDVRNSCPDEDDPVSGSGHAIQSVGARLRYRFGPDARLEHGRHGGEYRAVVHIPLGSA